MGRDADPLPQWKARAAGVFWLMTILACLFGVFAWGELVIAGNAAATAANRPPHLPADLPAAHRGCADGLCWPGSAGLSVTAASEVSLSLDPAPLHPRRMIADPVASGDRHGHPTIEGRRRRSRGAALERSTCLPSPRNPPLLEKERS